MKRMLLFSLGIWFLISAAMLAQIPRQDVMWAKNAVGNIVLDGRLDEPDWAKADSVLVRYGQLGPLPTSGFRAEFQQEAVTDPTHATVKYLVKGNQLYIAYIIPDSSVVGSQDWARWDGILMSIKDRASANRPTDAVEFVYGYWFPEVPAGTRPSVGASPRFIGPRYGDFTDSTRTPAQIAVWDAKTIVDGLVNDSLRDNRWTVEMRISMDSLGYNLTKPEGEIIETNFSIWDCDYLYEGHLDKISTTRTHIQSPWSNANSDNVIRLYTRPDVTTNTTTLPVIAPDVVLPNGANKPEPVIDGYLNDEAWQYAYTFNVAWSDSTVRNAYPGVGPWRSGQWQPELFGNPRPPVLDPLTATVKMFFRGTKLYVAADINDQLIQGTNNYDGMDAFRLLLGDRNAVDLANSMLFRSILVQYAPNGQAVASDYLPTLVDTGGTAWACRLKQGSTVNNYNDIDSGYVVEMAIDLTKLGYDANLKDRILFAGVDIFDGDSFPDSLANYGTRTWWFREHTGGPAAAWIYMDQNNLMSVKDNKASLIPNSIKLLGNYPNPFNPSTKIGYTLPYSGDVTIVFYNVLGKEVARYNQSNQLAGNNNITFNAKGLSSGAYFYKVMLKSSSNIFSSATGKLILMK